MGNRIKTFWYYLETRGSKILKFFGIRYNKNVIPKGQYCYIIDEERNLNEPCPDGGYWIKICPYFRSNNKGGVACTYTGFYGFDFCLYDQCKICNVNDEIDERDLHPIF